MHDVTVIVDVRHDRLRDGRRDRSPCAWEPSIHDATEVGREPVHRQPAGMHGCSPRSAACVGRRGRRRGAITFCAVRATGHRARSSIKSAGPSSREGSTRASGSPREGRRESPGRKLFDHSCQLERRVSASDAVKASYAAAPPRACIVISSSTFADAATPPACSGDPQCRRRSGTTDVLRHRS